MVGERRPPPSRDPGPSPGADRPFYRPVRLPTGPPALFLVARTLRTAACRPFPAERSRGSFCCQSGSWGCCGRPQSLPSATGLRPSKPRWSASLCSGPRRRSPRSILAHPRLLMPFAAFTLLETKKPRPLHPGRGAPPANPANGLGRPATHLVGAVEGLGRRVPYLADQILRGAVALGVGGDLLFLLLLLLGGEVQPL
jgi:hypothetical protein